MGLSFAWLGELNGAHNSKLNELEQVKVMRENFEKDLEKVDLEKHQEILKISPIYVDTQTTTH